MRWEGKVVVEMENGVLVVKVEEVLGVESDVMMVKKKPEANVAVCGREREGGGGVAGKGGEIGGDVGDRYVCDFKSVIRDNSS